MGDVFAIVSKAVFEKEALVDGEVVAGADEGHRPFGIALGHEGVADLPERAAPTRADDAVGAHARVDR